MSEDTGRWRQLALLATAQFLGMSVWFVASAVAPMLAVRFSLSTGQAAWLTSGVQLGFVVGTLVAAVLNLPDLLPSRWYLPIAALIAATANASLLLVDSYPLALLSRLATGVALAGVYPPAMKMASTWFKQGRGLAIGAIVGALTAGKALPYLLEGGGHLPLQPAILVPSGAAVVAALLIAVGYRDGPHAFPRRPFAWSLVRDVIREGELRRITGGYLGHMWELYALWAWIPAYLAASFARRGTDAGAGIWAFACVAIGAAGALAGGLAADRIGRVRVVRVALWSSGTCCLLSAAAFGGPRWLVLILCLIWGVAVIADSAQFSALVTEHAPPHAVGTALTLQTSLGFLLTIVTIQAVPRLAEIIGWQWALVPLVMGPMVGLAAMRGFRARAP